MSNPAAKTPVIDMWAPIVPTREVMDHVAANLPAELLAYLRVFTGLDITAEQYAATAPSLARTDEQILADLDHAGIAWTMVTGFDERTSCGTTFVANDIVGALVERHPGRFIAFAGADVLAGDRAVADLDYWIAQRGFRGLSLRPFMIGRPASDPFYATCVELDVPVSIHRSHNWTRTRPSDLGHPRHIDDIACRFPDLTIIMSHAGYPWVLEACLIAWKHPHVYLELGAHRPRYFTAPGAGWEPLVRYGTTTIADKVVYGTGAFLINRPPAELLEEMRALPIPPDITRKWLWDNAASLMGITR
ncbi:amidohydrolase family protein [Nocardia crassostreae]|uniref:amidohydrolase family protein n=1 Tax=Nocardia crassostreae TaxID=53428 RepID=UPI00082C1B63